MTLELIRENIKSIIQESIDRIDSYIYYENNNYKKRGVYCGPEQYSYEDDIYYSVRREINRTYRRFTLNIIKSCLDDDYLFEIVTWEENKDKIVPLDFIIESKKDATRTGFGLAISGTYIVKIQNVLLDKDRYKLDSIIGIQLWESDEMLDEINETNIEFKNNNLQFSNIYMKDFFEKYIGQSAFDYYIEQVNGFYEEMNKKTAIKVIPVLSSMYMPRFTSRVEKELLDYKYKDYKYEFIKDTSDDEKMEGKRDSVKKWEVYDIDKIEEKYILDKNYKIMLSDQLFAKTFMTSEWLFYSIDNNGEFDYTSIVTGYLKSIEQLLYYIMQLEINDNKLASINLKYISKALEKTNGVIFEEIKDENDSKKKVIRQINRNRYDIKLVDGKYCKIEKNTGKKIRIDNAWVPFNMKTNEYINDTMADYLYYLKKQSDIIPRKNKLLIHNIIDCFRDECRNGFFHTHIIDSWDVVKKIRCNALYIYFLVLGSLTVDIKSESGIVEEKNKLNKAANVFRQCITFIKASKSFSGNLINFPNDCDFIVSRLLKKYLSEKCGIETDLRVGKYISDNEVISHSWLETQEELLIDITRDQFKGRNDELDNDVSVYVGNKDSFHDMFEIDGSIIGEAYCYDEDDQFNYKLILSIAESEMWS